MAIELTGTDPPARRVHPRATMNRKLRLRKVPMFPFIPLVPLAFFTGSLVLSILSLARVRRLSRLVQGGRAAGAPA
jgi:hypothetical protein